MKPNKSAAILLVIVLAVGLSVGATGCRRSTKSPARLGLTESGTSGTETTGTTQGSSASGVKNQSTGTVAGDGESGDSESGTGGTGGTNSGGTGSATSAKTVKLKVLWWNDTRSNAPSSPEIVSGSSSYKPKAGKSDAGVLNAVPVGKTIELIVYPDGRSGKKMVAKIVIAADMRQNSDQDAVHIEVKDVGVRVLGNPVIDFIQSFTR